MEAPGLVRVCLRDKVRQVSGLVRPWRVPAMLAALEADPETVPELLVATQRFFSGHPFLCPTYDGLFGSLRRLLVDRRYTEEATRNGVLVVDFETRRAHYAVRGAAWRRAGWLYYHDGETFSRRRVAFRIPEAWRIEGAPEDRTELVEWNEGGPEPFAFLYRDGAH